MKKSFVCFNLIWASLIIVADFLYATVLNDLWMKGIASAIFVLMGATNLIYEYTATKKVSKFSIIMLIGLVFAMAGDIALNLIFALGAGLFAIGHIFYFFAYCQLIKFALKDLIASACIFVPSALIITLVPLFNYGGIFMEIVCLVYALIISLMVGKAITNLIKEQTILNIVITIGSALFFISDFMLLFSQFSSIKGITGIICLATYYPAQALLAYSLFQKNLETK